MTTLPDLFFINKELAERSLSHFIRQAWKVIEPGTPYIHNWHIDAICEHLEAVTNGQLQDLVINIPPRHLKSIAVSVCWPAWVWITKPEKRWIFASYAQSLSTRDSLKCRRVIQSPWYQENWGDRFQLSGDQNAKIKFENDKTGHRISTSVGGSATGEGGDFVVVDDPHNVKEALSDTIREATVEWWDQVMSTRLNDPKTGSKVIIMQRVHQNDLSGHVLEQGGYEHLCIPAEYEKKRYHTSIGFKDPRTEDKELLFPKRFDRPAIEKLKTVLGTYAAAGQLQQRPAPAEGGIFKLEWWQYYKTSPKVSWILQSWDTGYKTGPKNAYSCCETWGITNSGYYLLDLWREKVEYPDLKRAVKNLYNKWRSRVVLVEDKASGQSLVQEIKRGTRIPIKAVTVTDGDKVVRASLVSPIVEAGNVFLPEDAPWLADFIDEHTHFPNAAYADQVDTTSQALDYLGQKTGRIIGGAKVISNR
ncbi:phage uncharacterized protein (putative large terminase), C-terminal domain-containing protein [Desulforhopalus singaporensis]|uniref:Phage uncharacterized protein (Putative large terminase), C-terminal domain-containing protein n=1 Tax=Desulforhopalus singaporensis TaxID=91360 RepID=A0A1H0VIH3_9BACT|nr:phage uncharacterized protein (putative large terminase), C-terminal domain-containing protein [Desulforhopalus singaporensis]